MLRKEDERDRNKERERKKKRKRKYGQAKLKHSKRGIMSCAIAGSAGVLLTGTLVSAFVTHGTAAPIIGGLGIVAMILAVHTSVFAFFFVRVLCFYLFRLLFLT